MIITDPLRIVELSYLSILFLLLLRIEAYPVLQNCAVFKGKHLCWSHFLIKLQALNFIEKKHQHRCFL